MSPSHRDVEHRDGLIPLDGTPAPAKGRDLQPRSMVRNALNLGDPASGDFLTSTIRNMLRAFWLFSLITTSYTVLHGLGGWFPCVDSTRLELLLDTAQKQLHDTRRQP